MTKQKSRERPDCKRKFFAFAYHGPTARSETAFVSRSLGPLTRSDSAFGTGLVVFMGGHAVEQRGYAFVSARTIGNGGTLC